MADHTLIIAPHPDDEVIGAACCSGAGAPTVRKSWTLRMAPVSSGGATIVPMRQPVTENVFENPEIVMVRSAMPSSVAIGRWARS